MPEATYSEPFLWRPGRHGFRRLVAHVLIRLLILAPLPPQLQLGAALFPLSLVWPFLAPLETAPEPSQKAGEGEAARACVFRLTDGQSGVSGVGVGPAQGNRTTSGSFIVDPNDPLRGIHATALGEFAFIERPKPTFTKIVEGVSNREQTVENIDVRMQVIPADPEITQAKLSIYNNGVLNSVANVPLSEGRGIFVIAQGFQRVVDEKTTGVMEFLNSVGQLVATAPKEIPIGRVVLRLDSDNDSKMAKAGFSEDEEDAAAAREGKAFAFWVADPVRKDEDSFVDFARLRLYRRISLDVDTKIGLRLEGCTWEAHRQLDESDFGASLPPGCNESGKAHFCNANAVPRQLALNRSTDPRLVFAGDGDVKEIPRALLERQDVSVLFRVLPRATDGGCSATDLELGQILPDGSFKPKGSVKVDIKAFKSLASMISLRRSSATGGYLPEWTSPHYQVSRESREQAGWAPLVSRQATAKEVTLIVHGYAVHQDEFEDGRGPYPAEFETVAKRLYWTGRPILQAQDDALVVGVSWPGDIPGDINPVTRLILRTDATRPFYIEDEFYALMSGMPLARKLAELRAGPPDRKIGIVAHSLGNMVVNNALAQLIEQGSAGAPINYVMIDAAVPSEAFLQDYDPRLAAGTVPGVSSLLDHARALGFPNPAAGVTAADVKWVEQENEVYTKLEEYPEPFTCPAVEPPLDAWTDPECSGSSSSYYPCNPRRCDIATRYFRGLESVDPDPAPDYFRRRWGKHPSGSVTSAWTQLFARNVDVANPPAGISVFNTYNPLDYVLRIDQPYHDRLGAILLALGGGGGQLEYALQLFNSERLHAWKAGQILSKPFSPSTEAGLNYVWDLMRLGGAGDGLAQQKWWTLEVENRPSPWQSSANTPAWVWDVLGEGQNQKARRWAELALWFPALAPPAGVARLEPLDGGSIVGDQAGLGLPQEAIQGRNIDMGTVGGAGKPSPIGTSSHSYHVMKPFQDVWKGYRTYQLLLRQ